MDTNTASQTGDGTGNGTTSAATRPTWIEQLPEAQRSDESLYGFKTIGDLVAAHKGALAERDGSIRVPGENATDEERAAFYAKLGRPESPDGYEIAKPEGWPEGIPYDQSMETALRDFAHKEGISKGTAEKLWQWYGGLVKQGHEASTTAETAATNAALDKLKQDWPGDSFKVNTELAARAFKSFGGDDAAEFLEKTKIEGVPLGSHPVFLKLFAKIGKEIGDDTVNAGSGDSRELSEEEKLRQRFPKSFPT